MCDTVRGIGVKELSSASKYVPCHALALYKLLCATDATDRDSCCRGRREV